jgi:hypothetical protein
VLKRPSNGAPEMRADRVERACLSPCHPVKICWPLQHLLPGTMSLGRGGESVAPVFLEASANNVGLVGTGGEVGRWGGNLCRYLVR